MDMPLSTAFEIVLELANYGALDSKDCGASPALKAEMEKQRTALAMVEGFADGYFGEVQTMAPEQPEPTTIQAE